MTSTTATENKPLSPDQQTDIPPMHDHAHTCDDPTHDHGIPSFIDPSSLFSTTTIPKSETSAKRKNKKNKQGSGMRAELIPGNRGSDNVDDLVKFINSPTPITNDKKQKKKLTTATN